MFRIGEEEVQAVRDVILSKRMWRYQQGSQTEQFEAALADKMDAGNVLALSSGTGALMAALTALGVGPGDEVIVPAYTYISTAIAPLAVGAVPILVETDETLTMDTADLRRKITPRTRAIIPVHINGHPCAMDEIMAIAAEFGIFVLEDACQSVGGSYRGKRLGTIGEMGAFSFNHFKILSCGEGGAVLTRDPILYERARIYHDSGLCFFSPEQKVQVPFFAGISMRISELLTAVLNVQLGRLDGILGDLRKCKKALSDIIGEGPGWRPSPMNDPEGDCGIKLGILMDSPDQVQAVIARLKSDRFSLGLECPYDSKRHVYINWEVVMEQRGAGHPLRNPFKDMPVPYTKDMCPVTLDWLARTLYVLVNPDLTADEIQAAGDQVRAALASATSVG